jgi:hypothetical protein
MRLAQLSAFPLFLALLGANFAGCSSDGGGDAPGPNKDGSSFESDIPGGEASAGGVGGRGESAGGAGNPAGDDASNSGADSDAARAIVEADMIQITGDRLYALSRIAGLSVIDVSDPNRLALLGRYRELSGEPFEMYLRGDVVLAMFSSWGEYVEADEGYTFVQTSKLVALDARDPANIERLGSFDVAGAVSDSRIVGDVLYVVGYQDGYCWRCEQNKPHTSVLSLDISDPRAVRKVDELDFADTDNSWGWNRRSITVTDKRLYVAGPEYGQNGPVGSSIQVVDISDPGGDMVEGTSVQAEGQISSRWQMDEYQGVLRVVSQPGSWSTTQRSPVVQTFRVTSATEVTRLGRTTLVMPNNREVLQSTRFDGPRAYAITAERRDPLFVIDLSDPAAPRQRGELDMPGFVYHMEPRGERVIGLGYDQGNAEGGITVSTFDVSNMDEPVMLSRVNFGGSWAHLPEDQDRIHKAFRILDELGLVLVPFSGWNDVRLEDQKRCESEYHSGVQLVNLDGDSLSLRGVAPSVGEARRAFVHRDHLFTVSDARVDSFDIADRAAPVAAGSLAMARYVEHVVPLDGGIIARVNANYWSDSPWVDFVGADDVGAPQISLGELALGEAMRGEGGCAAESQVAAAFGAGSQVEILYQRYEYLPRSQESKQTAGLLIIDASDPSQPALKGQLEWDMGTEDGYRGSNYYWYDGFYDYGTYNPTRVPFARTGEALVLMEAGYVYSGGQERRELRLRVLDLRDPEQPASSLLDLTSRSYSGIAASGGEVLLGYQQAASTGRARFFVQPLDLSNPARPRLTEAVNVPGALLHFDAAHGRIVTSELARVLVPDTTPEACDERFGYSQFKYPSEGVSPGQTVRGACEGYRQTLHLVKLDEGAATLEGSVAIDEARIVSGSSLGDDRVFAVLGTGSRSYYYYDVGEDCFVCGGRATETDPAELLVFSGPASGEIRQGTLVVDALDQPWWGFWGAPPVHAHGSSALLTGYTDLSLIDASDPTQPALVSTEPLYGNVRDVEFADGSAFLALGQTGAQRIRLP